MPRKAFGVIASTDAPALVTRGDGGDEAAEVRAVEPHSCGRRAPRAIAVSPSLSSARRLSKRRRDTSGTKAAAGDPPEHKQAKFYRGVTSEAWRARQASARRLLAERI